MLDADPEELIDHAAKPEVAYDHKASMLQDVEARRQTEIDYLNGGIVRFGREHGVPTPLNEAIWALVKGVEAVVAAVSEPTYTGLPQDEIERRYRLVREAAARDGLDAVIVCGNEYTGFEGAVTYLSGFVIVHRYAYVLLPVDGEPAIVFPSEARYVGEHGTTWIDEQEFVDRPGEWLADAVRGKRVGVYGLDYVMTVRDYAALARRVRARRAGTSPSTTRAWSSRSSSSRRCASRVRINTEGFWIFLEHFEPGKTEREVLAPCEEYFVAQGCGRWTMDMVLDGPNGAALPEFKIAGAKRVRARPTACCRRSRSPAPAATGSRSRARSAPASRATTRSGCSRRTRSTTRPRRRRCAPGATARDAHRAVAKGFLDRGFHLGHVTGHSIGMTMIEFPKIGEHDETELQAGMVLSMHPHAISAGRAGVPLHAGHVARHRRRRRAARRPADEDLRRDGDADDGEPTRTSSRRSSPAPAGATTSATCAPTSCSRCRRAPDEWVHRDELLFQTVHQSSELWLKHAWVEVEEATRLDRGARPRGRARGCCGARTRALQVRRGLPRASRADVAVGVPGGAARARPRLRLRLAGLPRDPPRVAAALRRVRRRARASAASRCSRSTCAGASTRSCTSSPSC